MRSRKLVISAEILGFPMNIGEVTIKKFAEVLKPKTELRCPNCNGKPNYSGGYNCGCGAYHTHWSRLKRVVAGSLEEIVKKRLLKDKETAQASIHIMPLEDFQRTADATNQEIGVTCKDEKTAQNLRKLLVANKKLNTVVLLTWNDTFEQTATSLKSFPKVLRHRAGSKGGCSHDEYFRSRDFKRFDTYESSGC